MALERQSIEKKDFPIGRRGYEPEAVDTHLRALAHEVEELKRSSASEVEELRQNSQRHETLSSAASEHVRAIVEAAEASAAQIQQQTDDEARQIRSEATQEAQMTRERASSEANEYVERVSESTAAMLQRVEAMENELNALVESLRTGANRLKADLQLLESNFADVRESVAPSGRLEREAAVDRSEAAVAEPEGPEEIDQLVESHAGASGGAGTSTTTGGATGAGASSGAATAPLGEPSAAGTQGTRDDVEGARLIALNMALNGTPRQETDRYLAENFQLSDRQGLLDEVYASVGG
jgi:cell division septum initiation protein DivIVA